MPFCFLLFLFFTFFVFYCFCLPFLFYRFCFTVFVLRSFRHLFDRVQFKFPVKRFNGIGHTGLGDHTGNTVFGRTLADHDNVDVLFPERRKDTAGHARRSGHSRTDNGCDNDVCSRFDPEMFAEFGFDRFDGLCSVGFVDDKRNA